LISDWGKEIDKDSINIIIFGEKNETVHNDSEKILDSWNKPDIQVLQYTLYATNAVRRDDVDDNNIMVVIMSIKMMYHVSTIISLF